MAGLPKIEINVARNLFKEQGCTLLEREWFGSKAPIRYRCKERITCWNNFSRGYRCKLCYLKRFAESKGRKVLRENLFTITEAADILRICGGRSGITSGFRPRPGNLVSVRSGTTMRKT